MRATERPRRVDSLEDWQRWVAYHRRTGWQGRFVPCPWTGCTHETSGTCVAKDCYAWSGNYSRVVMVTAHCFDREWYQPSCLAPRCACRLGGYDSDAKNPRKD